MIHGELIVDNFAGGGGASTGIEMATGYSVDIAINHDPKAIQMHKTNHPRTKHYCEDVWQVDPIAACKGNPVGLAWFSPDCKHFSKAKGGKPKDKNIRGLAWVACRWAGLVRPRVIMLENVEEFRTWGPLNRRHHPVKNKQGKTFERFVRQLEELGYEVQFKELVAADYGAPTMRKRFFMIARCDGKSIVWPEPTHAPADSEEVKAGLLKPYVGAYTQLDFSLPCPSIFDTSEEIKEKYGIRAVRPLAPKTMERIARGLKKFVLDNPEPFIIQCKFNNDAQDIKKPLGTITTIVVYTRTDDVYDSPVQKARIGNESGADFFVSIHRNSSPTPNQYNGVQTLIYNNAGLKATMAENVNKELEQVGYRNINVVERPDLAVLRRTRMPAILVEAGFINSDVDNNLFDTKFSETAEAIARGIDETIRDAGYTVAQGDMRSDVAQVSAPVSEEMYIAKSENDASGTQMVNEYYGISRTIPVFAEETSQEPTGYQILVGIYRAFGTASYQVNRFINAGYDAMVYEDDGLYQVRVGNYDTIEDAIIAQRELRDRGYDTLIVRKM